MLLALSSNQKLGLALVAAAFVGFALLSAVIIPRSNPDFPERRLGLFIGVSVLFTVAMLAAVAFLAKESEAEPVAGGPPVTETVPAEPSPPPATETQPPTTQPTETEPTTTTTETAAGDPAAGKAVFTSNGCDGCHSLADAAAAGTVGPNLDASSPSYDKVIERVTNGKGGMPSFKDSLTAAQIEDVAAYVSSVTGS